MAERVKAAKRMKPPAEDNKAPLAENWGWEWPPNQLNQPGMLILQQNHGRFAKGTNLVTKRRTDSHIFLSLYFSVLTRLGP